jgi:hypothetical protein
MQGDNVQDLLVRIERLETMVNDLRNREEIQMLMNLLARAVDRCDVELIKSCYWEDGYEAHHMFNGTPFDFADYIADILAKIPNVRHEIGYPMITFDGDRAFAETKYDTVSRVPLGDGRFVDFTNEGRYLDILERRGGVWKIFHRHLVYDATRTQTIDRILMAGDRPPPPPSAVAKPDKSDPSYRGFDIVKLKPAPYSAGDPWPYIRAQFAKT